MIKRIEYVLLFYLLIPGGAENLLSKATAQGNLAYSGIFLEFYLRRNVFYFSLISISIAKWYFGINLFISVFIALQSLLYLLASVHRYHFIFEK